MKLNLILSLLGLLPAAWASAQYDAGNTRAWGSIRATDEPWVYRVSRPNVISRGLMGHHLSVWASHGRYYDGDKGRWVWQRPTLFATNEDLFTQTIVVPYLIPMLENAGAVVFTPRERDWQRHEVIVDNDQPASAGGYQEVVVSKKWSTTAAKGFAQLKSTYYDGDNPFADGTARQAKATRRKHASEASYQPTLPEEGRYAVYVSYQTQDKSVPDAHYTVWHKGVATEFTVNQRMGGGTWVYLGTFDFDRGSSEFNRVVVSNRSSKRGVVTTDAVRFGGGMGNISRGGTISGLPRAVEGARYWAQWAGAPRKVYGGRDGRNDYADDINTRSLITNWLAGGSPYVPTREGLGVPIELSLAVHSDAGYEPDGKSITGSLAICTTDFNDGVLDAGISRQASKDLARALLDNLTTDLKATYGRWNKRYLWDRNYSETRLPEVPSAIIEMLSHQNFPDMRLAQDPHVKFTIARSLYKTILRFVTANHGEAYAVQPLTPSHFAVTQRGQRAVLSWQPTADPLEPTAQPTSYILYTAAGTADFDNGRLVRANHAEVELEPGVTYRFRVAAVNAGGESFATATLATCHQPAAQATVLVVDGFKRLASPQVIDDDTSQGFDLKADPGVSLGPTLGWLGYQTDFSRSRAGSEGPGALGWGDEALAGQIIAGNDRNHVADHVRAIAATGRYNVVSCSKEAVEQGRVALTGFQAVDLVTGLERADGYSTVQGKALSPAMRGAIEGYLQGGGRLLASGAYLMSDSRQPAEQAFLASMLKASWADTAPMADSLAVRNDTVRGLGLTLSFYNAPNARHYAVTSTDNIAPVADGFTAMQYNDGTPAAVAYRGPAYRTFTMAIPWECIIDEKTRYNIMNGVMDFLLGQ